MHERIVREIFRLKPYLCALLPSFLCVSSETTVCETSTSSPFSVRRRPFYCHLYVPVKPRQREPSRFTIRERCCFRFKEKEKKSNCFTRSIDMLAHGAKINQYCKRRRSWRAITSNWIKSPLFLFREEKHICARSKDRSGQEGSDAYA